MRDRFRLRRRALHGAMCRNPDVGASMEVGVLVLEYAREILLWLQELQEFIGAFNACEGEGFEAYAREMPAPRPCCHAATEVEISLSCRRFLTWARLRRASRALLRRAKVSAVPLSLSSQGFCSQKRDHTESKGKVWRGLLCSCRFSPAVSQPFFGLEAKHPFIKPTSKRHDSCCIDDSPAMPGNTWTHSPKLRASDPTRRCHGGRSCGEDLVLEDQGFFVGIVMNRLKYLVTRIGSQVQYGFCLSENFLTYLWRAGDATKEVIVGALLP